MRTKSQSRQEKAIVRRGRQRSGVPRQGQCTPAASDKAASVPTQTGWAMLTATVALALRGFVQNVRRRLRVGIFVWYCLPSIAVGIVTFFACGAPLLRPLTKLERVRAESVEITAVPASAEFYLSDGQQSPLAVATSSGQVRSRALYHAYGQVRNQTGRHGDPFGYVGSEEDRGSGLSDFGARPYRPELGAFLAVDPLALFEPEKTIGAPARLLAYAYAGGDPVNNADPNGLTFGEYVRGVGRGLVDAAKSAARVVSESAKTEYARVAEGRLGEYAKTVLIERAPIAVAVKGVAGGVQNLAAFGDDFANAAFAASDYEAGRLAVKPMLTAMSTAATVMGGVGAGKQLAARRNVPRTPVAEVKDVRWYHGSFDRVKVEQSGFGTTTKYGVPAEAPYVCVSVDRVAAENAISYARYDARYADPAKLGIVEGQMSQSRWDALHSNGDLRTNSYFGFDNAIVSSETKAMTANGVRALNDSMKR